MKAEKLFLHFVLDSNGLCFYRDSSGLLQKANISSGKVLHLKNDPAGWMDTELAFKRNDTYFGLNRSYSTPLKFIKDTANMIREIYYDGQRMESNLTLLTFKLNEDPATGNPVYEFYDKSLIDLSNKKDIVIDGFQVNLMQGGIYQLFKAYENTKLQIPCDGSIKENIKVLYDGMIVEDTFHFEISQTKDINFATNINVVSPLPAVFINNEGDNYGVNKNSQSLDLKYINSAPDVYIKSYAASNSNYLFYTNSPLSLKIKGNVVVRFNQLCRFRIYAVTNTQKVFALTNSYTRSGKVLELINYDTTINLDKNEGVFLMFTLQLLDAYQKQGIDIESGSVQLDFQSKAKNTRAWAINPYDLWKLIVNEICKQSSSSYLSFNFGAESDLLNEKINLVCNSGDALRASGDSNYQKYFQPYQVGSDVNSNYGPVIKTTIADFIKSYQAILCAAVSNEQIEKDPESLFFERIKYVFDADGEKQMDIGEISDVEIDSDEERAFTGIKIGYTPQKYDQKAGKYETNTTAEWITPIKSRPDKKLELISPYRTDPFGIELLRSTIQDKSISRNDSDSDVFITNIDYSRFIYDFQRFSFESLVTDINNANNTNQKLLKNTKAQAISLSEIDGSYLSLRNDSSIFVFSYPGLNTSMPFEFSYNGILEGPAGESITIKLFLNGSVIDQQTFEVTGAANPFNNTFTLTRNWVEGDCLYAKAETSVNGSATIVNVSYKVGTLGTYWTAVGSSIKIDTGTATKLIPASAVVAPKVSNKEVVRYGFQYFVFNSILYNPNFDISLKIKSGLKASPFNSVVYQLYKNGQLATYINHDGTDAQQYLESEVSIPTQPLQIGDIFYLQCFTGDIDAQVISAGLTFTSQIKAYYLKRVNYDQISGILVFTKDADGNTRTDLPGSPYNIEDLTPRRMLENWFPYIKGFLYNLNGNLSFGSLSKNEYLFTRLGQKIYDENADIDLSQLGSPLFYAELINCKANVPKTFASMMKGAVNAHINATYFGMNIHFFPMEMKQKPALNESQKFIGLFSPKMDISIIKDLDNNGLKYLTMDANTMGVSHLSSWQYVPLNYTLDEKYAQPDMNVALFEKQILHWLDRKGYVNPWKIGDPIPVQVLANGLSPIKFKLYKVVGEVTTLVKEENIAFKDSNSVVDPINAYLSDVSTEDAQEGFYYAIINGGGSDGVNLVSEGYKFSNDIRGTLLFEYTNSTNRFRTIFEDFTGRLRVEGYIDNTIDPQYKAAFYVTQPQDITITGAFPYETRRMVIKQVPDYIIKKISRIMLLDSVKINGVGYTIEEGAKWEPQSQKGSPLKDWSIVIRPSENKDGIVVNAEGITEEMTMMSTLDQNMFGPNYGNTSRTDEQSIIKVEI